MCHAYRYEGRIVQQLILNDGGNGEFVELTPPALGIWNTLLEVSASSWSLKSYTAGSSLLDVLYWWQRLTSLCMLQVQPLVMYESFM